MRSIIVLLCLLMPYSLFAQTTPGKDTLFVVDGRVVGGLKNINPHSIVSVDILKEDVLKSGTFCNPMKCAMIVTTDSGAVESYKRRFSKYSKAYKKYIESHIGNTQLLYVLDGEPLQSNSIEAIRKLYELDKKNIRRVTFKTTKNPNSNVLSTAQLIITTKNRTNINQ